ncbi:MAG TPA: hypothetical protein VD995_20760 [Azospirillum sp.]|nr:hypothetical protein [Azospirillum sp.]
MPTQPPTQQTVTRDQVIEICGRLDDMRIASIIATGATAAEVMEAYTWLGSDDYLASATHRQPSGRVARLVEVLKADEPDWDDR